MRAAYVRTPNAADPVAALQIGEVETPEPPAGWVPVTVQAASINHHDLWSLRGRAVHPDRLPMVLGTDAAGVTTDGQEVIVHAVIARPEWVGDETLDPQRTLLSEWYPGTMAEQVSVPPQNLVAKPAGLSFEEAACLPTAWLTAWRMLTQNAGLTEAGTVLVQGASGGVATAAVILGHALGHRVWVTSRSRESRELALARGAAAVFAPGDRVPERVDAVLETVGEATWAHSVRALRPGGTLVICGATTGANPPADLNRIFFQQLRVIGSTMGTRAQLAELATFLIERGIRPPIDRVLGLDQADTALAAVAAGGLTGKVVLRLVTSQSAVREPRSDR
ncbi:MAG: zinc-binding dehydrogenase [Propioniciclava sp.]